MSRELLKRLGSTFAAVWIFGGAFWFHVRFALIVYNDRRNEIDAMMSKLRQFLPF
jgi:hypothetical protein